MACPVLFTAPLVAESRARQAYFLFSYPHPEPPYGFRVLLADGGPRRPVSELGCGHIGQARLILREREYR